MNIISITFFKLNLDVILSSPNKWYVIYIIFSPKSHKTFLMSYGKQMKWIFSPLIKVQLYGWNLSSIYGNQIKVIC